MSSFFFHFSNIHIYQYGSSLLQQLLRSYHLKHKLQELLSSFSKTSFANSVCTVSHYCLTNASILFQKYEFKKRIPNSGFFLFRISVPDHTCSQDCYENTHRQPGDGVHLIAVQAAFILK